MLREKNSTKHFGSAVNQDCGCPVMCPRCSWLGTKIDVGHVSACPICKSMVNPLRQKGLDSLRTHHRVLSKMGSSFATTLEEKNAERTRLEQFFQRIGAPL